jgi:hypothetical protein
MHHDQCSITSNLAYPVVRPYSGRMPVTGSFTASGVLGNPALHKPVIKLRMTDLNVLCLEVLAERVELKQPMWAGGSLVSGAYQ